MNVVKSIKVGNFRHDLVDTGFGWQVRVYIGDKLYDTGFSKNSEQKGLVSLESSVAYTEKQIKTKRQGVAEGSTTPKVTFAQSTPGSWARIDILVNGVKQFVAAKTIGPGFWSIFDLEDENIGGGSNKSEIKSAVLDYLSKQGVAEDWIDL